MLQRSLTIIFVVVSTLSLHTLAAGTQFITGPCTSDADCASSCCGFNSGKCAGPVIAQTRDGGCGHGDPEPNRRAADDFFASMATQNATRPTTTLTVVPTATPNLNTTASGNSNSNTATNANGTANANAIAGTGAGRGQGSGSRSGKALGMQFITGPCGSDVDCASGCCGFRTGKCAGPIVAQERDGGCGFGDARPNSVAAQRLRGGSRFRW